MAAKRLSMKLLVDKKASRVLFAEVGKDVVDFLFSLLSLPIGSVIRLLTKSKMVGCIGNLYQSVEKLEDTYVLQPRKSKELLLKPKSSLKLHVPLLTSQEQVQNATYFFCANCCNYLADKNTTKCPACKSEMVREVKLSANIDDGASCSEEGGFVKGVVTYMVMDDLTIMPMSTISSITLLHKCNVENVNLLEEKVVDFGMDEGLELLKASLQSRNVLSQVFLAKKLVK